MQPALAAGVDVGGRRKGFHAACLDEFNHVELFMHQDAQSIAAWLCQSGASVIGVDAPCRWNVPGGSRLAERELVRLGFRCFFTPTRLRAEQNQTNFYEWIFCGQELFHCLKKSHPLLDRSAVCTKEPPSPVAFETFPRAIARRISPLSQQKGMETEHAFRRSVVESLGIALPLSRIGPDFVDAILCAFMARLYMQGRAVLLGEQKTGFLVIPHSLHLPIDAHEATD